MPDYVRLGRAVRALRRRRGWRQVDLAAKAHVSETTVVRVEGGSADRLPAHKLDRIAQALGARLNLRLDWNGEALDRLLDSDHARLVELFVRFLGALGWEVATEVTFAIAGERGSVDVLARHPGSGAILVVEAKTVVPDIQGMLAALDRKARLGLAIARQVGWDGSSVSRLLMISESRTSRRRVTNHAETFARHLPHRVAEIRQWIRDPEQRPPIRGLWFLADREATARHRVPRRCLDSPRQNPPR